MDVTSPEYQQASGRVGQVPWSSQRHVSYGWNPDVKAEQARAKRSPQREQGKRA